MYLIQNCVINCAREKSGLFVGHTEAICTGYLSGHNAVRFALGIPLLILPSSIAIGDLIAYENERYKTVKIFLFKNINLC